MRTLKEAAKYLVYRTPVRRLFDPRYPYYVNPAELAFLCDAISATKLTGGAILEIGVAKGETSIFLMEHLRTTQDGRPLYLIDTFCGFTAESIDYERRHRAKSSSDLAIFRWGSPTIFADTLRKQGYSNFKIFQSDATQLHYQQFAPIAVVFIDIDLYKPTRAALEEIWPHLARPSFILVDDCAANTPYDGALSAYEEFIRERGLAPHFVGEKGGIVRLE
jgi:O-methyltransferase